MEEYEAAGKAAETIKATRRELERWGSWLKNLRPRPALEEVNADLIIRYLRGRGAYRAKATLSGAISKLRCMGEFLVREGVWLSNPLRWLRGPKLDIRSRLPRRISPEVMRGLWEAAATHRYGYHRSVWVTLLSIFYGTGMRRGDVLPIECFGLVPGGRAALGPQQQDGPGASGAGAGDDLAVPGSVSAQAAEPPGGLGRSDESALFVSRYGGRLTASAISRGIQKLGSGCSRDADHDAPVSPYVRLGPVGSRGLSARRAATLGPSDASARRCVICTWPIRSCIKRSRSIPSTTFLQ